MNEYYKFQLNIITSRTIYNIVRKGSNIQSVLQEIKDNDYKFKDTDGTLNIIPYHNIIMIRMIKAEIITGKKDE